MKSRRIGTPGRRAVGMGMIAVAAVSWGGFVAAGRAGGSLPNTGMADPLALVGAYDRFASGASPAGLASTG